MSQADDLFYDDDQSVTFIRNYLPQELKERFTEDDLLYIVDLIYEYYEDKGYLSDEVDDNEVVEIDESDLIAFVVKQAQKDKIGKFESDEIAFVVQGELAYCESMNLFE
jgi:hypothetical protein